MKLRVTYILLSVLCVYLPSLNSLNRGALIVFEGCDRSGKTTQCKKLVEALKLLNIPAEYMNFPNRTTPTGKVINDYLQKKTELTDKTIHLLFSANRWELEPKMTSLIREGTTLIVDRYAFSGVAFSAAKEGLDTKWCKAPDEGLLKPDIVFLLQLNKKIATIRADFGNERYECSTFQEKVVPIFNQLKDSTWQVIDADKDVETLHKELLEKVLEVVKEAKTSPLGQLWE